MSNKQFGPISWGITSNKVYLLIYSTSLDDEAKTQVNTSNYLTIQLFKFMLTLTLPPFIKSIPLVLYNKQDVNITKIIYPIKQYGIYIADASYTLSYGVAKFDNDLYYNYIYNNINNQTRSGFLPWMLYKETKHLLLNNIGNVEIDFSHPKNKKVKPSDYPTLLNNTRTFAFKKNKDDESIMFANVRMEYREWNRGDGYFKWLRYFNKPIKEQSISIIFYDNGYYEDMLEMRDEETSINTFIRWCLLMGYTFVEEVPFSSTV